MKKASTTTSTAPWHARHVPPGSGRRQVPHPVPPVRIRGFPPPLHSQPVPYKYEKMIIAQGATEDTATKTTYVTDVQGISLALIWEAGVMHVAMATELMVKDGQNVQSVQTARSVSMH